jgi:molybdate transport system regulatory protein
MKKKRAQTISHEATVKFSFKLRILLDDAIAIGPGKAELLGEIEKHGSIAAAAREMGMSYRRAWQLVETMNNCFVSPLVLSVKGGSIPGETKVLSILIYDHAEALDYDAALRLSLLMLIFSFVVLFIVYSVNRHFQTVKL